MNTLIHFIRISVVLMTSMLIACASGYNKFYQAVPSATPEVISQFRVSPPPTVPVVEHASFSNSSLIFEAYAKRGYVIIGQSMFNSGHRESEASAIQQAKEVGADVVLIFNPKYTGSVSSSVPITTPTTSTSHSSGLATVYGPAGPVTAYGSGTTTTYGSTTTYVPITVHRSDYGAVYFVKRKYALGVLVRDLNDSERDQLQSNKGTVVHLVVDDSPAFDADILVGDVITSIDGAAVSNSRSFRDILAQKKGRRVMVSLLRKGQIIEKAVQLGQ